MKTGFLQVEIRQRLFVLEQILKIARSGRSFFGICGDLREQSGFESKAAVQTPSGFRERLNKLALAQTLRLVFVKVGFDVLFEGCKIVRRQQDCTGLSTPF